MRRQGLARRITGHGDHGNAWPLVDLSGRVYGAFVIEGIDERQKTFLQDGTPLKIDFGIDLLLVDDDAERAVSDRRQYRRMPRLTSTVRISLDKIRPRLASLSITEKRGDEADQLDMVLDDSDGRFELPSGRRDPARRTRVAAG